MCWRIGSSNQPVQGGSRVCIFCSRDPPGYGVDDLSESRFSSIAGICSSPFEVS